LISVSSKSFAILSSIFDTFVKSQVFPLFVIAPNSMKVKSRGARSEAAALSGLFS